MLGPQDGNRAMKHWRPGRCGLLRTGAVERPRRLR